VENRRLYNRRDPEWDRAPLPPGRARVVRRGRDVTVVAWGRMVSETLRAMDDTGDLDAELIDLRTLAPLDLEVVFASVAKTGRCLIVHEAVEAFGPGAEIAARIADGVLWELDGPIARFGALPSPVPYSPALEAHMLPTHESIAAKLREVVAA
jgi:pyruvate/2-oxoglutarate/acetoin dehydrogenase E1 component